MASRTAATALLNTTGKALWLNGWTDPQIAEKIGCSKFIVWAWRNRHGLKANLRTGTATALLNIHGKAAWSDGRTDPQIAEQFGCSKALVCMWRKRHGLKANAPPGSEDWKACCEAMMRKREEAINLHELGDVPAAKLLGISKDAFRKRRWRMGLQPVRSSR